MSNVTLQSGFFPTTDQETQISGRIDRVATVNEAIMLRYAFTNSRNFVYFSGRLVIFLNFLAKPVGSFLMPSRHQT
jgi:hypothetical protein